MAFSAKTEYGLIALIDLADAHGTGALLQTGDICRRHGIPLRYLEQMLTALRKGGFLTSIRGPRGGFQLVRTPEEITIAAVEICLEGEPSNERQGDREDPEFQVLMAQDQKLDEARASLLSSTTLADLLAERNKRLQPQPMFYI